MSVRRAKGRHAHASLPAPDADCTDVPGRGSFPKIGETLHRPSGRGLSTFMRAPARHAALKSNGQDRVNRIVPALPGGHQPFGGCASGCARLPWPEAAALLACPVGYRSDFVGGLMKMLSLSLGVAVLLVSTSFEASAAYCRARGVQATGWGRSDSPERARNMALSQCSKRGATCWIEGCMH